MKTKKKTFVALLATFAVGTAAVAGLAFGVSANANYGLAAHADTVAADETITNLVIGENSITLTANEVQNCIIGSSVEGEHAPAGYYTFTQTSGSANFEVTVNGQTEVKTLNRANKTFTVLIYTPDTTIIPVYWTADTTINFTLSYSETDPDAAANTLTVGEQTVNANGDGIEYVFTSEEGGTYQLDCTDENAFIMVEGENGAEQILWVEGEDYETTWELEYQSYVFTLEAGGSISFLMATNDWMDGTYSVTLVKI